MKFLWNVDNDVAIPFDKIVEFRIVQNDEWEYNYRKYGEYVVEVYSRMGREIVFAAPTKAECIVWIANCFSDQAERVPVTISEKPEVISGRFLEGQSVTVRVSGKLYTRVVGYRKDCGLFITVNKMKIFEYEF